MIEERIEHDRQTVVDVEVGVARQLGRHNLARRSVAADGADVQRRVGEQNADLRVLGWFAAFKRLYPMNARPAQRDNRRYVLQSV